MTAPVAPPHEQLAAEMHRAMVLVLAHGYGMPEAAVREALPDPLDLLHALCYYAENAMTGKLGIPPRIGGAIR